MSVDYDLVIIGGSLAAREAALMAVRSRANVALVEPPGLNLFVGGDGLGEVARQWQASQNLQVLGLNRQGKFALDWLQVAHWCRALEGRMGQQLSQVYLTGQGVDLIVESSKFTEANKLALVTKRRKLTARRYLLASGSHPLIPKIEGLDETGFVTVNNLLEVLSREKPPQSWTIIGETPQSLEIAQILAKLGLSVLLITLRSHIWENVSPAAIQLFQAQLEADGVEIICAAKVTQTRRIGDKKWLQVGDRAIESDEILIAIAQEPRLDDFNLAAVDVKWEPHRLIVNDFLQTSNPRIYACGDILGGYPFSSLASYEARIAVNNSLSFQQKGVNYQHVPYTINTQPPLAHIGFTLAQAKKLFPERVVEIKEYFKDLAVSQVRRNLTGICSVVVRNDGQILGASVFGENAGELINLIALAMQQQLHIKHLRSLPVISSSYSQICSQIARKWQEYRLSQNHIYQEFLDDLFQLCRHFNL